MNEGGVCGSVLKGTTTTRVEWFGLAEVEPFFLSRDGDKGRWLDYEGTPEVAEDIATMKLFATAMDDAEARSNRLPLTMLPISGKRLP